MSPNAGFSYRERIATVLSGETVLGYLARRYPHSTQAVWRERIGSGQVRLDGGEVEAECALRVGQTLVWHRPPWEEPEVPRRFDVLHEDTDLLAISKPAGLPTVPAGGYLEHTLLALVRESWPGATPMHRLGRWTSGVVLFARTAAARSALAAAWRSGAVDKRYRALAGGEPEHDAFTVDAPIGPVPYAPLGHLHAACEGGRPARSHIEVVRRGTGEFLAAVRIESGRPHQIRIHLAFAGHPLVGDPLYGSAGLPAAGCTALPGDGGYRLHAHRLELRHPRSGRQLRLVSPPPGPLA